MRTYHEFTIVCPSPFGPAQDCPGHDDFLSALARAREVVKEGGPVQIFKSGEMIVSLAGHRPEAAQ